MRRLLIALAVLVVAVVAIVLVTSRGGDEPTGDTQRGLPGLPLRGSLARDKKAIDSAVAEWREDVAEDAEEEDDDADADERLRRALSPKPDDDIAVLWIGRTDERQEIAVLEHRGLLVLMRRPSAERGWFISARRVELAQDTRGALPLAVGDAVIVPERGDWRFVNASQGVGYEDRGDGLFWADGGIASDGFLVPTQPRGDRIAVYVTGIGPRVIREDAYPRFADALDGGYGRAVWQATRRTAETQEDERDELYADDAPAISVLWTGELPGQSRAALVLDGDGYAPRQAAALGYGEVPRPDDAEERDEGGAVSLGIGRTSDLIRTPDTFAAAAYTAFDDVPYLVLAGAGAVETLHALIGDQEVRRRGPLAVIDARRYEENLRADTVVFGRSASGNVIAPLLQR